VRPAPRFLVATGLALAVLVPAACSDDGPGEGEARLEVAPEGEAVVQRAGERTMVVGGSDLQPGDRVQVTEGLARLELSDGVRMELRAGAGDADNSVLVMGEVPVLEAGDVLVAAPEAMTVEAAGTSVEITRGAAQVSRRLGMGVSAYDATVELDSAGLTREVPALRQMQVPALGRPRPLRPLEYDEQDGWDRRYLGEAIELGERLERLANGYTENLDLDPNEGRTVGFFKIVLPGLDEEPAFDEELLTQIGDLPPGETLIGAAISDLGDSGSFDERWRSVFGFREEGAEWGLVALDQDVSGSPLVGAIEQAIGLSPLSFDAPVAAPPVIAPATRAVEPTTTTARPSSTATTTAPPTTTPPDGEPPPTTAPPLVPIAPTLEPIVEPVTDLLTGLLDGLLGVIRRP
jgi:hypothetical protein